MKKTILTLIIAMGFIGSTHLLAQDFTMKSVPMNDEKIISYSGDIDVPGVTKDSLYKKAYASLKSMYKGFVGKLIKNDATEGRISMNGIMTSTNADKSTGDATPGARVRYVLIINIADGKLSYNYTNFVVEKGKKKPLESYYYNEPEVKMSKGDQETFFHSIDYQMKSDVTTLTRKLNN